MIKKYECKDCGHQFEAEVRNAEKCPQCESIDIFPIGNVHRIEKWHLYASFFLCAVVGYIVSGFALYRETEPQIPIPPQPNPILVKSIILSDTLLNLQLNNSSPVSLSATVTPFDADNSSVAWSCSNEAVATVSSVGIVEAVGEGSAIITCTALDGSGVSDICEVTVSSPPLPPPHPIKLSTGELQQLINTRSSKIMTQKHPQVADSYQIKADDGTSYSSFQDINNKFKYRMWKSVVVKSVNYDGRNRVNAVFIHPIKNEDSSVEE